MSKKTSSTNIGNVIKFEIIRNLKKPTFWIAALIVPVLLIGYIAVAGFSGYNASLTADQATDTTDLTLGFYDAASYLSTDSITNADNTIQKLQPYTSKEQGIAAVKNDQINIFYYLPPDFGTTLTAEIYAKTDSTNIFTNYETPLRNLLATSAAAHVDPTDFAVISNTIKITTTNFTAEGTEYDMAAELAKMIIPAIGLALFYILICIFGNRLTTAMVEEKENRISEMILTSLNPRDLIIGKIISLIILGLIQIAVLIIPIVILAAFGISNNLIPSDLRIDFNFWTILSTLVLLLVSFFLFTSLCVAIGTLVPTAKDAGQFAGVIMIMVILPIFFVNSFMTNDNPDTMVYILSFFPPSAPIALMFRNLFGTLPLSELLIGLAVMIIASALIVKFSVFVYSRTALEFTSRVSLRKLLQQPRKDWK